MGSRNALITDSTASPWGSCGPIVRQLVRAHRGESFSFTGEIFEKALQGDFRAALDLAGKIRAFSPERVIFVDHRPHPLCLLTALDQVYGKSPRPSIYFHWHGDFLLQAPLWKLSEDLLRAFKVFFFCASPGQKNLFSRMIHEPEKFLGVCPYPVDTDVFHAQAALKTEEEALTLVYAGRLSLQKNVDLLLKQGQNFWRKTSLPLKLLLAGSFDDLGAPLFEGVEPLGASFQRFQKTLKSLDPEFQKNVTLLGPLSAEELCRLYHQADALVSLSLHHDEDFGMAPAEALCTGCPTVLSAWGGYPGFTSQDSLDCQLIPVSFAKDKGHLMDEGAFQKALLRLMLEKKNSASLRKKRAAHYQSRFSISAVADLLLSLEDKAHFPFQGWTPLFNEAAERMKEKVPFSEGPRRDSLYGRIYSAYLA
jgi:glycosyltransferase involved in cell wall biosynthesis